MLQFRKEIERSHKEVLDDVHTSSLSCCELFFLVSLNVLALPFMLLIIPIFCYFYEVKPNEVVILEGFGKPVKVVKTPGLNFKWLGLTKRNVTRTL